eukprot:CAMPEP_0182919940 /NCGR_PEP_ID=MMETSP0105_2-20130417/3098_1 /TAXON_ID=81532 ORGANISM="Acanthoeca-like sp., Strain 10tr" /NCGR_SAMPLE_ID=MMETSP0105_2 /ASSEMBLY_ACC=CAM_ASM_000205 /LENGTH=221 /DNA_ID=CAMNT_0025057231 /DNA_START=36 /DNA_END=698 /DNA_ORIENTATION=+
MATTVDLPQVGAAALYVALLEAPICNTSNRPPAHADRLHTCAVHPAVHQRHTSKWCSRVVHTPSHCSQRRLGYIGVHQLAHPLVAHRAPPPPQDRRRAPVDGAHALVPARHARERCATVHADNTFGGVPFVRVNLVCIGVCTHGDGVLGGTTGGNATSVPGGACPVRDSFIAMLGTTMVGEVGLLGGLVVTEVTRVRLLTTVHPQVPGDVGLLTGPVVAEV